jgi:hypothetical protein
VSARVGERKERELAMDTRDTNELYALIAGCTRPTLERYLVEKLCAVEAPTRDDIFRLFAAELEVNPGLRRPAQWSEHARLFDWLPHALVAEIISYHDAKNAAKAATVCSSFAGSTSDASTVRAARLGLTLPRLIEGDPALSRLWFSERVGKTGLQWKICTLIGDGRDSYDIALRHSSGLTVYLSDGSNGFVDYGLWSGTRVLTDCLEGEIEEMTDSVIPVPPDADDAEFVSLFDYLRRMQPHLTGHFCPAAPCWGFSVRDGCIALVNESDHEQGLLTAAAYRFLHPVGITWNAWGATPVHDSSASHDHMMTANVLSEELARREPEVPEAQM